MSDTQHPNDDIPGGADTQGLAFDDVALKKWEEELEVDLERLVRRWAAWAAPRAARSTWSGFRR